MAELSRRGGALEPGARLRVEIRGDEILPARELLEVRLGQGARPRVGRGGGGVGGVVGVVGAGLGACVNTGVENSKLSELPKAPVS